MSSVDGHPTGEEGMLLSLSTAFHASTCFPRRSGRTPKVDVLRSRKQDALRIGVGLPEFRVNVLFLQLSNLIWLAPLAGIARVLRKGSSKIGDVPPIASLFQTLLLLPAAGKAPVDAGERAKPAANVL
jgi:hypothetical protein